MCKQISRSTCLLGDILVVGTSIFTIFCFRTHDTLTFGFGKTFIALDMLYHISIWGMYYMLSALKDQTRTSASQVWALRQPIGDEPIIFWWGARIKVTLFKNHPLSLGSSSSTFKYRNTFYTRSKGTGPLCLQVLFP